MAGKRENDEAGGCAAIAVGLVVAFLVVAWSLSSVGHLLGLTPSFNEAFDRPDGWVGRHYRGVVWGYVLTVAALATLALLGWLAVRTRSDDPMLAARARAWLRQVAYWAAVLAFVIVVLPVGQRPGVDPRADASGPAREGNVPDVVGLSAARAEARIEAADLSAGFDEIPYDDHRCRVFAQDPPAGGELDEYGTVELRCRARIPDVVGMKADRAESRLSNAGFDVRYANEPADYDFARCRVLRQSRSGSAEPNATIGMRLRCAKPPPPPAPVAEPVASCDPSYEGACLDPDAYDYDCAGGTGDGPEYTGPVAVIGDDHYGLDSDGDGSACE